MAVKIRCVNEKINVMGILIGTRIFSRHLSDIIDIFMPCEKLGSSRGIFEIKIV